MPNRVVEEGDEGGEQVVGNAVGVERALAGEAVEDRDVEACECLGMQRGVGYAEVGELLGEVTALVAGANGPPQ